MSSSSDSIDKLKDMMRQSEEMESQLSESLSSSTNREKVTSEPKIGTKNLDYLMYELGCTNSKILRSEKLLDQFILLKALVDGSLPKLLFNDIKIFKFFCQDVFPEIPSPEMSNKFRVKEVVEQQFDKQNLCVQEENV